MSFLVRIGDGLKGGRYPTLVKIPSLLLEGKVFCPDSESFRIMESLAPGPGVVGFLLKVRLPIFGGILTQISEETTGNCHAAAFQPACARIGLGCVGWDCRF